MQSIPKRGLMQSNTWSRELLSLHSSPTKTSGFSWSCRVWGWGGTERVVISLGENCEETLNCEETRNAHGMLCKLARPLRLRAEIEADQYFEGHTACSAQMPQPSKSPPPPEPSTRRPSCRPSCAPSHGPAASPAAQRGGVMRKPSWRRDGTVRCSPELAVQALPNHRVANEQERIQ